MDIFDLVDGIKRDFSSKAKKGFVKKFSEGQKTWVSGHERKIVKRKPKEI